ncbi:MAG: hypothetical protein HRT67_00895 [Flavobacteriaceae bacterium]|nr:hypothetical protein [Flavobacteriaceae bacterium]
MTPKIITTTQKQLIGLALEMSLIDDKTQDLFSSFMPHKKHIQKTLNNTIYEIMLYSSEYFKHFDPRTSFTKWVAV